MNGIIKGLALACAVAASSLVAAQSTVKIAGLVELSGTGAASGTNFDNGVKLAVKEINAAGGILGRKIDCTRAIPQTNRRRRPRRWRKRRWTMAPTS